MHSYRALISKEAVDETAHVIEEEILRTTRVHDYILQTVDNQTGVPIDFMVNDEGVFSTHVMVSRGQPMDVPAGTWRQLDYDSEEKFEFARLVIRRQLEQWGVAFQSDHRTLRQEEARERVRIKP